MRIIPTFVLPPKSSSPQNDIMRIMIPQNAFLGQGRISLAIHFPPNPVCVKLALHLVPNAHAASRTMGIQATVVQDGTTRRTVIVRATSSSPADRHGLVDTIASFSEHVASLQGKATSPIEVSALWGGPPYISYTVVAKRFRVIVVWEDAPGELDVAQDVHECVVATRTAVAAHADGLAKDDPVALGAVYDAAGAALLGDMALGPPASPRGVAGGAKKSSGLRKLFGKGKAAESPSAKKGGKRGAGKGEVRPIRTMPSADGGGGAGLGHVAGGKFDDAPSSLQLPESVFAWADFGEPIPPTGGDIAWIAELLRGDVQRRPTERPRVLDAQVSAGPSPVAAAPAPVTPVAPPTVPEEMALAPVSPTGNEAVLVPPPATTPRVQQPPMQTPQRSAEPVAPAAQQPFSSPPMSPPAPAYPIQPEMQAPAPAIPLQSQPAIPTPMPPPATPVAMSTPAASMPPQSAPAVNIPPALAAQAGDDFDVGALGGYKDDATVSSASSASAAGRDPIRSMMNDFAKSMQAGNFTLALSQVTATLRALASITPPRTREILACAHYSLAQKILMRCDALDRTVAGGGPAGAQAAVQAALLSMFLAELKNLLPRHRLAAMRMALEKNLAVGNFGMAARWIRQIAERAPPAQKQALAGKLQVCRQNGEVNRHMPTTNKMCYNLLTVITGPHGNCGVCSAVYRPGLSGVNIGQKCPTCFVGTIVVVQ